METRIVSSVKALELQATMNVFQAGRLKVCPAHHNIEVTGKAMLVEPANGDPFVFLAPNTVHVFTSKPGSGTDHLRQRMLAGLWFQQLADKQSANEPANTLQGM